MFTTKDPKYTKGGEGIAREWTRMGANTETEWAGRGRGREALKWRANLGAGAEVVGGAEDGRGVEAGGVFAVAVVAAAV